MNEIVIYDSSVLNDIKEIFYLSSSIKNFESEEKKALFFQRWCGDYIIHYPDQFYIMRESNTKKTLGYLSGCADSKEALIKLDVPGFKHFEDMFHKFPAHFHINFHPDCRGKGFGSVIVEHFCSELLKNKTSGIHLITSPDAQNVSFYRRLKFTNENSREFGKMRLLFMGRNLC